MQTPEELAREVLPLPACCFDPMEEEMQELADLIRARDAEVLREAADELPGGMSSNGCRDWLHERADQIEKGETDA